MYEALERRLLTLKDTVSLHADACRYAAMLVLPPPPTLRRSERRILLLARALPPHFHGGAFRQVALLRALTSAGWEVDVVTEMPPSNPTAAGVALQKDLPGEIRLHRWETSPLKPSYRLSTEISGGFSSVERILEAAGAVVARPSIVLATGPTFAEFLAAACIAQEHRAPCVLDYRDEWTTNPLKFIERGKGDRAWERLILARAAACVFATDSMHRHYLATFSSLRQTLTATIRNGWDSSPALEATRTTSTPGRKQALTVGFFGWLGDHWDFGEFAGTLDVAGSMATGSPPPLHLAVYGRVDSASKAAIRSLAPAIQSTLHGLVPRHLVHEAMVQCDALLLLTSPRLARTLPGKLYEYIASRKPILLYGSEGEMAALLETIPGVTIVPRGQPALLAAALERLRSGTPEAEIRNAPADYVREYHREHRNREWIGLLESMLAAAH